MRFVTPLLVSPLVLLLACGTQQPTSNATAPTAAVATIPGAVVTGGDVMATLDNVKVDQGMVDIFMSNMPETQRTAMATSPQYPQMVKRLAVQQALYEKALEAKLHENEDVKKQIAFSARMALATAYVQNQGKAAVSEEAVKKWYEEKKVQYEKPQVKASHILVKEESKAKELLAQVNGGGDFAAMAKEHSVDPGSGKKGGDLGWFDKGKMVESFAEAAFAAEKGQIVGPVESRFGFHIIKVEDKRDKTPLDEVRPKAEEQLFREAVQKLTKGMDERVTLQGKAKEVADSLPARPSRPGPPGGGRPLPPRGKGAPPHGGKPPAGKPPAGKPPH